MTTPPPLQVEDIVLISIYDMKIRGRYDYKAIEGEQPINATC